MKYKDFFETKFSVYLFDVGANQERELLGDQVGKVNQRLTVSRDSGEDNDLGPVVLDVLRQIVQGLDAPERRDELLSLSRGSPVGFRFPVADVEVEDADDGEGDQGGDPVHEEHDGDTKEGPDKRHPFVVIFEGRTPSRRLGDRRVEDREVDESIRSDEEIRQQCGHNIQLA